MRFQAGDVAREVMYPDVRQMVELYNRDIVATIFRHRGQLGLHLKTEKEARALAETHQWYADPNPDRLSPAPWILVFDRKRPLPSDLDWVHV